MLRDVQLMRLFYDTLLESQYWPNERLHDLQRTNLRRLLRHAHAEVPFYKDRLAPIFSKTGEIDWDHWHEIPVVRRRDLLDHREAMQARHLPSGHGPSGMSHTSGSTGLVVEVTSTALQAVMDDAARLRGLERCGIDWTKNLCSRQERDPTKALWPDGTFLGQWGPPWRDAARGQAWRLYKGTPAEKTFEFLVRNRCEYLNVGAKTAHALAIEARRLGVTLQLDAILGQGEDCDEHDRDACRSVFGAEIIQHYASKEAGQVAHPCELGNLHLNEENVLVEILDELGQPCAIGVPGRVVVTPFYSTAQPLVRYEQGDIAVLGSSCPCGRSSRTIDKIIGRIAAIFRHPDGRAVSRILPLQAYDLLCCDMLQIAQTGPTQFEVRYVPSSPNAAADESAFRQMFHNEYFDDADLRFLPVDRIVPMPSGKFAQYVNEYYAAK